MRKRTIRNGMRLLLAALLLIILASFFHGSIADLFNFSPASEQRFYRLGIFWAAAIGGYGVVLAAFGFVLPTNIRDSGVRVLPVFIMIMVLVVIFFYLFVTSFTEPIEQQRLSPGTSITI